MRLQTREKYFAVFVMQILNVNDLVLLNIIAFGMFAQAHLKL